MKQTFKLFLKGYSNKFENNFIESSIRPFKIDYLRMKKLIISLTILVLLTLQTFAQFKVSGTVTNANDGNPMPGVNIMLKGTTLGTVTDLDGNYTLEISDSLNAILMFSSIGMISEEVGVKCKSVVDVELKEDVMSLDEVIVVGYGSVRKSDMTGAISSVKAESYSSASSVLAGRYSGISVSDKESRKADKAIEKEFKQNDKLLTAGEINDFSKWELWKDISNDEQVRYQSTWKLNPQNRYTVQVLDSSKHPVIDAKVELMDMYNNVVWSAKTENTGKAELWNINSNKKNLKIKIEYKNKEFVYKEPKLFEYGLNLYILKVTSEIPINVDVAFVVDATSSMNDEIEYLRAELYSLMKTVKRSLKEKELRMAAVFYRDYGDEYLTKKSAFSSDIEKSISFIKNNTAGGGGDTPEAVDLGLSEAIDSIKWSENALCRVAFLILDAPPHENKETINNLKRIINNAAKKGIRVVPVTCSGIDKSTEYLMRTFALLTNGTYVFLTDDSGIGNAHIKPSTDEYEVELLNDLILRLLYQYTYLPDYVYETDSFEWEENVSFLKSENREEIAENPIEFKIFPVPCHDKLNIKSKKNIKELYINDISGKILERHVKIKKESSFDLSQYPNGTYFINTVFENGDKHQEKFLKINP